MKLKNRISELFFNEYNQWVHWIPVLLGFGVFFYFNLLSEPPFFIFCIGLFFALFFVYLRKFWSIAIALFLLGFCIAYLRTHIINTPFIHKVLYQVGFSGIVDQIEYLPDKRRVFISHVKSDIPLSKKLRVRIKKGAVLQVGDHIKGKVSLMPISFPPSPYSFNYRRDAYFKGIGSSGRLIHFSVEKREKNLFKMNIFRDYVSQYIRKRLSGDVGEIAVSITTGDKTGLSQLTQNNFARAGMSHILAISGLHLSIISAIFFVFLRYFLCFLPPFILERCNSQKIAACITLCVSFFYLFFSGLGYPVQRSFIMIALFIFALLIDRKALSIRSVSFAALFILLIRPEGILSASFQLSFAAVIPLIASWEIITQKKLFHKITGLLGWFGGVVMTTFVASTATMPFAMVFFNQLTLHSIMGNVMAIPLFSFFVMPLGVLSLCFGSFFYDLWGFSIKLLIGIAYFVSDLPGSCIQMASPNSDLFLGLIILGGLWVCLWKQNWRFFGFIPIICGVLLYRPVNKPDFFINDDCSILGWVKDKNLFVLKPNKGKYFLEQWARSYDLKIEKADTLPQGVKIIKDYNDFSISKEDILIVSPYYIKRKIKEYYPNQIILDRSDFQKNGCYFIWKKQNKVLSMGDFLGKRPWLYDLT